MAKNEKRENERKDEKARQYDLSIYVNAIGMSFEPAIGPSETTHWFSTEEVVSAIKQIDPSAKVDASLVYHALSEAGYKFCNRPSSHGLQFKWMFREKEQ